MPANADDLYCSSCAEHAEQRDRAETFRWIQRGY